MPLANRFRHQTYNSEAPTSPYHLLSPPSPPQFSDSPLFAPRMAAVGDALRNAGVAAIYLVHGTFVGNDALGLFRPFRSWIPSMYRRTLDVSKQLVDAFAGEAGNYTRQYAELFESAINVGRSTDAAILVRRFHWSSENHHLGRADAAVRLMDELDRAAGSMSGRRILLWGHSHAGNVFALLTNLLAADTKSRDRFFAAARPRCRVWFGHTPMTTLYNNVHQLLQESKRTIDRLPLDIVTFGTPIRYGWDTSGCSQLLHFVNHRSLGKLPHFRTAFPPKGGDVSAARHGDYVQQVGIAGTGMSPGILDPCGWWANRRLTRMLQPGLRRRHVLRRLSHGMRVPHDGTTLLVDYGDQDTAITHHVAGHAVYTRREWLLFHAETVAERFYGMQTSQKVGA